MITLHEYSAMDKLQGETLYRYVLECDGYELGHCEAHEKLKHQDVVNRILWAVMVSKTEQFYKFLGYRPMPGLEHHTYKVNDTTMGELLKDKKRFQIKSKLKEIEGDFEDAR